MNRWKAASIHLSVSFTLATSIGTVLYFLWFPQPYFIAAGASSLIILLLGVDVGIGPLLTLIVVSPRKSRKLLKLDLSVIAALQAIAFAYGIHVIAVARPVFLVAAVDRLMLVSADDITNADLALGNEPAFRRRSWTGPVLAGVQPGGKNFDAFKILISGKDLTQMPQYYMPYGQVAGTLMHHAKSISQFKNVSSYQRGEIERTVAGARGDVILALPVQRGEHFYTALMSSKTQRPLRILSIDPWQ